MRKLVIAGAAVAIGVAGAPRVHADPTFPDMSDYTAVDPQAYVLELPNPGRPYPLEQTRFVTPDGVACVLDGMASCVGNNLPGIPPASPNPGGGLRENAISTGTGLRQYGRARATDLADYGKTLPAFHSITVDGVTCGVDDAGTTACKDAEGRGFVLSQHGSGWLEHV